MTIRKASNLQVTSNISMMFKGPFGVGKTLAATSFAVLGPIYLAYFDKNIPIELLMWYKKYRPDLLDNIDYESFSSSNANEYLNRMIGFTKDCRYVAVITDSVTNLTSAAVNWSMGFRDVKGGGKKDKLNPNAPQMIPDFDEYKVETSLVTQALDISKTLPVYNIWIAHPVPGIKVEGTGAALRVTKQTSIVSYGSKVAGIIPGNFTEIYHFGRQVEKRLVWTDMVGDDYAKTCFELPNQFDITDKLFYEVWKSELDKSLGRYNDKQQEVQNGSVTLADGSVSNTPTSTSINPFANGSRWKT